MNITFLLSALFGSFLLLGASGQLSKNRFRSNNKFRNFPLNKDEIVNSVLNDDEKFNNAAEAIGLISYSPTASPTPSVTPSASPSSSATPSPSMTASITPSPTPSNTPSASPSASISATASPTPSPSRSQAPQAPKQQQQQATPNQEVEVPAVPAVPAVPPETCGEVCYPDPPADEWFALAVSLPEVLIGIRWIRDCPVPETIVRVSCTESPSEDCSHYGSYDVEFSLRSEVLWSVDDAIDVVLRLIFLSTRRRRQRRLCADMDECLENLFARPQFLERFENRLSERNCGFLSTVRKVQPSLPWHEAFNQP